MDKSLKHTRSFLKYALWQSAHLLAFSLFVPGTAELGTGHGMVGGNLRPSARPDSNYFHSDGSSGIKATPCWVKPPCYHTNHHQGWKQAKYKSLSLTKIQLQSEFEYVNQTVSPRRSLSLFETRFITSFHVFISFNVLPFYWLKGQRGKLEILRDSVGWSRGIKKPLLRARLACYTHEPHTQGVTDERTILLCGKHHANPGSEKHVMKALLRRSVCAGKPRGLCVEFHRGIQSNITRAWCITTLRDVQGLKPDL